MIQSKSDTSKRRTPSLTIKRQNKIDTHLTLLESVKGYLTNLTYGFQGFKLNYFCGEKGKQQVKAFILGSEVRVELSLQLHQDVAWFTYRRNIPISQNIHSDVGWGCLIRVAQMAWAHSLQRYFSLTQKKVEKNYIITAFLEQRGVEFKYNLFRFMEMGAKLWRLQAGQWYSMTQAATTLQALHQSSPLKGSQHLIIKVYSQTINIKEMIQTLGLPTCSCLQRRANCLTCHKQPLPPPLKKATRQPYFQKTNITLHHKESTQVSTKHIMMIVTAKLGVKNIGKSNYKYLLQFMSMPIFNGCMGGMPQKARFLTGRYEDNISYLDPHYVESAVDQMSLAKRMGSFQCKEVRYMSREELDPQMAICFYITGGNDLQMLIEGIDRLKGDEAFMKYDWEGQNQFEVLEDDGGRETNMKRMKEQFQDLEESFSDLNRSHNMDSSFLME